MDKPRYKYVGYRPEECGMWGFEPGFTVGVDPDKWRGATVLLRAATGVFLVHAARSRDRPRLMQSRH